MFLDLYNKFNIREDITNIHNSSELTTILNGLKREFMETAYSKLKLRRNYELFAHSFFNIKTKFGARQRVERQ